MKDMKDYPERTIKIGVCKCKHQYKHHAMHFAGFWAEWVFRIDVTERRECNECLCPMYEQVIEFESKWTTTEQEEKEAIERLNKNIEEYSKRTSE